MARRQKAGNDDDNEHPLMQVRKAVTLGTKDVRFNDGSIATIDATVAEQVLAMYDGLKPGDKIKFQMFVSETPRNMIMLFDEWQNANNATQVVERGLPNDPIFGIHDGYSTPRTVRKAR